jgi:hypothetical protein
LHQVTLPEIGQAKETPVLAFCDKVVWFSFRH